VDAVLGHSFGGKVALELVTTLARPPAQVWIIDSTPEPRAADSSAMTMLTTVRRHPGPFRSRQALVDLLTGAGYSEAVAAWMASNLGLEGGEFRWRIDFDLMEALLRDFAARDYWHVITSPPPGVMVHVVKATESSMLSEAACARIEEAAARHGRAALHTVSGGHWLNTDNPDALIALLSRELPRLG
jgi:pimeloyl-ACP methyl ester carboxylesterase